MPGKVSKIIQSALKDIGKSIEGSEIGILGVAYKGNVADARETPAEPLIKNLMDKGAIALVNDPYVSPDIINSWGAKIVDLKQPFQVIVWC